MVVGLYDSILANSWHIWQKAYFGLNPSQTRQSEYPTDMETLRLFVVCDVLFVSILVTLF